jgi:hypothetical protein
MERLDTQRIGSSLLLLPPLTTGKAAYSDSADPAFLAGLWSNRESLTFTAVTEPNKHVLNDEHFSLCFKPVNLSLIPIRQT